MVHALNRVFHLAAQRVTSLAVWLWAAPFLVFGLVATELPEPWSARNAFILLAIGVASHLALGCVLYLGNQTILSQSRRAIAGWKQVLAVLVTAAIFRSLVIAGLIEVFDVGKSNLILRMTTSIGLITVAFTLSASSYELWRVYRTQRDNLLTLLALGERSDRSHQIATSGFSKVDLASIERGIEEARLKSLQALETVRAEIKRGVSDMQDLSLLLRDADKEWREVSHRAWKIGEPKIPRITLMEILRSLAARGPLSLLVLSTGPVYAFFRLFEILPEHERVGWSFLWWVGALILGALINRFAALPRPWGIFLLALGFLALQMWGFAIGALALDSGYFRFELSFVTVVSSLASLGIGLPLALERSGHAVLGQLEERLSAATLRRLRAQGEMFVLAKRIGVYLHSEIRGEFLRLSMELKSTLDGGDLVSAEKVIDQMTACLTEIDSGESRQLTLHTLEQFLSNWASVVRLSSNLSEVRIPQDVQKDLSVVVMDAVNDAVRHGNASWINIQAREIQGGISLRIESDSAFVEHDLNAEGLGSLTLSRVAPARWSRELSPEGHLVFQVALQGPRVKS